MVSLSWKEGSCEDFVGVTLKEVKSVVLSIKANKSLGPNGINLGLYKKFWNIVGGTVTDYVETTFRNKRMAEEMNGTLIALIPKVPNLANIKQLRHISLCNVHTK